MNKQIDTLKKTRGYLLDLIKDLSVEQLNKVPEGYKNNIIWNLAHMIASQQGICYVRAGLKPFVAPEFFNSFKPNTQPDKFLDANTVENIKALFMSTLDQVEKDYSKNLFVNYPPWTTQYGVELRNVEEAMGFLYFHDGLHTGYIMALKHLVK